MRLGIHFNGFGLHRAKKRLSESISVAPFREFCNAMNALRGWLRSIDFASRERPEPWLRSVDFA